MSQVEKHVVGEVNKRVRLSDYCVGIFEQIPTRKGIKKAIKKGWIWHNGEPGRSGQYVSAGDTIWLKPEEKEHHTFYLKDPLKIVLEDDWMAVVDKPAHLVSSGYKKYTLENALPNYLTKSNQLDALDYPQVVHRLDKETQGVIVVAKTRRALRILNEAFANGQVSKSYVCWVHGQASDAGEINLPLEGKTAITRFTTVERVSGFSRLQVDLLTGRTHQIRRHLACIGHSIYGDPLYGHGEPSGLRLVAQMLTCPHPISGLPVSAQSHFKLIGVSR